MKNVKSTLRRYSAKGSYLVTPEEFYRRAHNEKISPADGKNCITTAARLVGLPNEKRFSVNNIHLFLEETISIKASLMGFRMYDWSFNEKPPEKIVHLVALDPANHNWCYHRKSSKGEFVEEHIEDVLNRKSFYDNDFVGRKHYSYLFNTEAVYLKLK